MLRRVTIPAASRGTSALATRSSALTRTYFTNNTGEVGIWGASMKALINTVYIFIAAGTFIIYKAWNRYSPNRQWVNGATDWWESDGTVMEGEEAVGKMKVDLARVMPFIEEYQRKVDEATGGSSDHHAAHH